MSYDKTALGILQIALTRNLKKDFKQHANFGEQIDYWVQVVNDHGLDPNVDKFASGILALDALYDRHKPEVDEMHQAIGKVLTLLADKGETGGFEWSNCDFVAFQDILKIADRSELGSFSLREAVRTLIDTRVDAVVSAAAKKT
jgi:hypothetical protein